ncbi:MAG: 2-amino-4-hydroxy-6-hydroxymethyldihydropteridine diphosphokinase [Bacteroidota bacterium]|nr:2-amino-4-hydroxy-6-hydroxymethyldihydropteridine diphosphokinase [Bacteroidota bacterium]MDP3144820.1 2-amino-4-hydroxy-6-hydroxymethyldihydropteridine diphosphokinase [Bacteroidota bacterium]MDP3557809.1 2-amino-4-hydroxy-6-hydroxymethyldihydropteridine diphosphokinase [Bacteroidota bacterium]
MNVAFLCLGGNIGNRIENISASKREIERLIGAIESESSIYETQAWGSDSQNNYLNQVIKITTKLNAKTVLKTLLKIEKKLGRKRSAIKNNDRTIDLDILLFNNEIINEPTIEIPHPRMHKRKFVLKPLSEIASSIKHPVLKKTISDLYKNNKDKLEVKLYKQEKVKTLKYICIEGNIGSGKTTLAKALASKLNATFLPEEFENNPFLPLFYENQELFAFPLEYSFLIDRFRQIEQTLKNEKKLIVSDYSLYKCLWFAEINLSKSDFQLFKKQFKIILDQLPKPDLIIHLTTTTKNLKQNIIKRNRKYEKNIAEEYLIALNNQYHKGLKKIKNVKKLNLVITNYNDKLESSSILATNNFIKENFGK